MSTQTGDVDESDGMTDREFDERLRDLPPSAKLVAKVLEIDSPLSQSGLADETLLPDRTVRYALNRLDDAGLVESRYSFDDARKRVYALAQ
jgi:DNA-binding MarR family transcriptional regulator